MNNYVLTEQDIWDIMNNYTKGLHGTTEYSSETQRKIALEQYLQFNYSHKKQ
jgi:hypothetical protein